MGNLDCCYVGGDHDWTAMAPYSSTDEGQPDGDVGNMAALTDHKLLKAARDGDVMGIHKVLAKGADIETRCPFWVSPESHELATQVTQRSRHRGRGLTPLMCASQGGYYDACIALLAAGACINAQDEDGMQPLHFAASSGSAEVCRALLDENADPSAQDDEGRTPLDLVPPIEMSTPPERRFWRQLLPLEPAERQATAR